MQTTTTTFEYCEKLIADSILTINNMIQVSQREKLDKEDIEMELYRAINLILSAFHGNFNKDDDVYIKWVSEVLLCAEEISFEEYYKNPKINDEMTREELLGLFKYLFDKSPEADLMREKNLRLQGK